MPETHYEDDHDRSARLTNDDFRKLLMTPRGSVHQTPSINIPVSRDRDGPKSTISMAPPSKGGEDKAEKRRKKKSFYAKLKKQEDDKMAELAEKYRDRAKERRDGVNPDYQAEDSMTGASGYRAVAPDIKSGMDAAERRRQMIQESKFLGGDMEHTHLVKGLDYALLQKVRSEIHHRETDKEEDTGKTEELSVVKRKITKDPKSGVITKIERDDTVQFQTRLARNIYHIAVASKKVERNELFAPGRMAYCIDLEDELADSDIPTTLIRSKADIPNLERSVTLSTNDIVINKLAQILSYLRQGARHGKKGKKKGGKDERGHEKGARPVEESIYGDIGDYVPKQDRDKSKAKERKKSNYFEKPDEETGRSTWESVRPKSGVGGREEKKSREEMDSVTLAKNTAQLLTKLAAEPEGYAECYPGLEEMQDAIDDSDDEVDYTKMDLGNKKGPIGRWDFDTQEEYSQYMNNKEAMPKAAFQYGVKMADGRRTRTKNKEKNEKQQLDREWNKIQNIIQKRKTTSTDDTPNFKVPKY